MNRKIYQKVVSLLSAKNFFLFLVALFVVQAVWIALSGRYPMAFDEDFHLGIIKLYVNQWSPFFVHQPSGSNVFGELTRDPSYVYHYIMSFPYRLTNSLFHNEFINIMTLRFFSIGFVVSGLFIFRRVLEYTKASAALINVVFLFFILTPLVTFEAAQINYDNMLIPLVGLAILWSLQFVTDLKQTGRFNSVLLLSTLSLCIFASLVMYLFLPLFVVILFYLLVNTLYFYKGRGQVLANIWHGAVKSFLTYSKIVRIATASIFIIASGLFLQMYGYNLVKYHEPVPDCAQVLSANDCRSYGVWNRDFMYAQTKTTVSKNPIVFTGSWMSTYFCSFFFPINGSFSGFQLLKSPAPIYWTSLTIFWTGIALTIIFARRIFNTHVMIFIGALMMALLVALWLNNYSDYIHLGQHVAEQGRYVLIVLLPVYCIVALAFKRLLEHHNFLKTGVFVLVFVLFMQGGGIITYIVGTDPSWWWQNDSLPTKLNESASKVIKPVIIDSKLN